MRNKLMVLAIIVFAATNVNAQMDTKMTTVSIGINVGVPTSPSGFYSITYGGDLQADFAVAPTTKITASAGYQNYSVKSSIGSGHTGMIPLLAGAKFNLGEKAYGHAQIGYGFGADKGSGGAFAYAPSIGYYFSPKFDASVKYLAFSNDGSTLASVNLRLAYNF